MQPQPAIMLGSTIMKVMKQNYEIPLALEVHK